MLIYIDDDYKCHTENDGTMRPFEVPLFDGKCRAYIEGQRYVPKGETWAREDGVIFEGEMISPFVDSRILEAYQRQYEAMLPELEQIKTDLADADEALNIMEVHANDTD